MKKILNYIGSRGFAICLMVLTTAVILFTNLLPNLNVMEEREAERLKNERPILYAVSMKVGVSRITKSPYFQVIPVFILLSVTVCTVKRVRAEKKRRGRRGIPENPTVRHTLFLPSGARPGESARELLRRKGWKVEEIGDSMVGRKGESGFWGSILFHAGMDAALIGFFISAITGVDGVVSLTEGFPVPTPQEIRGVSRKDVRDFPLRELMLESFEPTFEEGRFHVDYTVRLAGMEEGGGTRRYVTKVNEPLTLSGYNFVFRRGGYAPRFILKGASGEVILDAVVNMRISVPGKVDHFSLPDEGLTIRAELFPDYYEEGGEPQTRGDVPNNPVLFVKVERQGKAIGRGFLQIGKEESFDAYRLEFRELRHWVDLIVSRDKGVKVVLYGFTIIVAGLVIRFILTEKMIWVIMKPTEKGFELGVGGRAGYFPAMFDEELKRLAGEIERFGEG